jgi:hypothetical protein
MLERLQVALALIVACALLAVGFAVSDQVGASAGGPPTGVHSAQTER